MAILHARSSWKWWPLAMVIQIHQKTGDLGEGSTHTTSDCNEERIYYYIENVSHCFFFLITIFPYICSLFLIHFLKLQILDVWGIVDNPPEPSEVPAGGWAWKRAGSHRRQPPGAIWRTAGGKPRVRGEQLVSYRRLRKQALPKRALFFLNAVRDSHLNNHDRAQLLKRPSGDG